jgi:hypothetical protein
MRNTFVYEVPINPGNLVIAFNMIRIAFVVYALPPFSFEQSLKDKFGIAVS